MALAGIDIDRSTWTSAHEFIVCVEERLYPTDHDRDRLAEQLGIEFPGYFFAVQCGDDLPFDAVVVPIIGAAGERADSVRMLDRPSPDLVSAIEEAVRGHGSVVTN